MMGNVTKIDILEANRNESLEPLYPQSSSVAKMYTKNMASVDLLRELERRGILKKEAEGAGLRWTFPLGYHWDPMPEMTGVLSPAEVVALRRIGDGWRPATIKFQMRMRLQALGYLTSSWKLTPLGRQLLPNAAPAR